MYTLNKWHQKLPAVLVALEFRALEAEVRNGHEHRAVEPLRLKDAQRLVAPVRHVPSTRRGPGQEDGFADAGGKLVIRVDDVHGYSSCQGRLYLCSHADFSAQVIGHIIPSALEFVGCIVASLR